jgi:tetratricopeptide (TPR) repeat protein
VTAQVEETGDAELVDALENEDRVEWDGITTEGESELEGETASVDSSERAIQVSSHDLPERIHETWQSAFEALGRGELTEANKQFLELDKLKLEGGFESLDAISVELLGRAQKAYDNKDVDQAAFLVKRALQLSPESPDVLLSSMHIADKTNVADTLSQLSTFASLLLRYPAKLLEKLQHVLYPALWAATIGLFAAMVFVFMTDVHAFLRGVSKRVPIRVRGIVTPPIALLLLTVPLLFGPLWALFIWALLICVFVTKRKSLSLFAGVTLVLWGVGIDYSERLSIWFADPGIQALIRTSSGAFHDTDRRVLEELIVRRPNDAAAHYAVGQLYRRYGDFDLALKHFDEAEKGMTSFRWVDAQRGMIAFLRNDIEEAEKRFASAGEAGLDTPQYLVNYSKVKFAKFDTEKSREFVQEAMRKDPELTKKLQEREEKLGLRNANALSEVYLPFSELFRSAAKPFPGYKERVQSVSASMMPGPGTGGMMGLGIFLCIVFFSVRKRDSGSRLPSYYGGYESSSVVLGLIRVIPGGAWMLAGRPVLCFILLSVLMLFVMPLLGWPATTASLSEIFPHWLQLYTWSVFAFLLFVLFLGTMLKEEH